MMGYFKYFNLNWSYFSMTIWSDQGEHLLPNLSRTISTLSILEMFIFPGSHSLGACVIHIIFFLPSLLLLVNSNKSFKTRCWCHVIRPSLRSVSPLESRTTSSKPWSPVLHWSCFHQCAPQDCETLSTGTVCGPFLKLQHPAWHPTKQTAQLTGGSL